MNVERGGMGVSMKSARVEVPRVTIPAPEKGMKSFAPKETIEKDSRVQGFKFDTFKPFVISGQPKLTLPETSKVSLVKEKLPERSTTKSLTTLDGWNNNGGVEVKSSPNFSGRLSKLQLEKRNNAVQNLTIEQPKVSLVKPERIRPTVSLIKQKSAEIPQEIQVVDLVKKQQKRNQLTVEPIREESLNPILPKPTVPDVELSNESYKVNLEKPATVIQSRVSLRKPERIVSKESPVLSRKEKTSPIVSLTKQGRLNEKTLNDKASIASIDQTVANIVSLNKEAKVSEVAEKREIKNVSKVNLTKVSVKEGPEEKLQKPVDALKPEQPVAIKKVREEMRFIQRESDLQQAQTVIKAWERLAGPEEKESIKEKVMAIIDQKQEVREVTSSQQAATLAKNNPLLRRPFIPQLEQEEFETIVRGMVKEGLGLETIYKELQERKVLVNQEAPSLTVIFRILLAETTVKNENKQVTVSDTTQKKTVSELFETPQKKKRMQQEIIKEEALRTVEEEQPEHDLICFIGDLEQIATKELLHEDIKDEFAIGNYITVQSSDKGDAQGIVNKKTDAADTKLIESDGKIGLEEICPACLGLLKERELKMTVTRNSERMPLRKTSTEVIVFNYSKSSMDLAA